MTEQTETVDGSIVKKVEAEFDVEISDYDLEKVENYDIDLYEAYKQAESEEERVMEMVAPTERDEVSLFTLNWFGKKESDFEEIVNAYNTDIDKRRPEIPFKCNGYLAEQNDDSIVFPDEVTAAVWIVNSGQISDGAWENFQWEFGSWERWLKLSVEIDEDKDEVEINSRKSFDNIEYVDEMTEFESLVGSRIAEVSAVLGREINREEFENALEQIEAGIHASNGNRSGRGMWG